MLSIRLAHWREEEGRARAAQLEALGFSVRFDPVDGGGLLGLLKAAPPAALVMDLSRSPALGRDLAVAVRIHGSTRNVPLVFVGGSPEKVTATRSVLPDATYASWDEIGPRLREAMASPPREPHVPSSALAGYSGTPLPKKLGIKPGTCVLLARAPGEFPEVLGELPEGVRLLRRFGRDVDLILWFVRSVRELEAGIQTWAGRVGKGGIWIVWPKKSSALASDLSQSVVRKTGLSSGLVDYKIAAIDETWSGLKFAVRRRTQP